MNTDCLNGLISFRQTLNPEFEKIDSELVTGTRYVTEYHGMVTVENIMQSAENFRFWKYLDYNSLTPYAKGDIVKSGLLHFESKEDNNTGNLLSNALFWKPTNLISIYLRQKYQDAVNATISKLQTQRKLETGASDILQDRKLYDGSGNHADTIVKEGRFVGLEITFKNFKDLSFRLNQIGTQFTRSENITFYLYHSGVNAPLATFVINHGYSNIFKFSSVEESISQHFNNPDLKEGVFYIGYYENSLTASAIEKKFDMTQKPCGSCNQYNVTTWNIWNEYLGIEPFYVLPIDIKPDLSLWDTRQTQYNYLTNFGLNLSVTIKCDLSEYLCRNKSILTDALGSQLAMDIMKDFAHNGRNNADAEKVRQMASYYLYENEGKSNPRVINDQAINNLSLDFSGLNPCCNKKIGSGIKVKSFR